MAKTWQNTGLQLNCGDFFVSKFQPFYRVEGNKQSSVVLTCEHASNALPPDWHWSSNDQSLKDSHWAVDLGAKQLTLQLASMLQAPAVIAGFSRLIADPNRPLDSATLFRKEADGNEIDLNKNITDKDKQARLRLCYHPYHQAIDQVLESHRHAHVLLSVHTFTPVYEGIQRSVGVGVLYERHQQLAERVCRSLETLPAPVRLNEPYSGTEGFMFSASSHAERAGLQALEIEVRHDLFQLPGFIDRLVGRVTTILSQPARVDAQIQAARSC